jgi:hypothetical protein
MKGRALKQARNVEGESTTISQTMIPKTTISKTFRIASRVLPVWHPRNLINEDQRHGL